MLWSLTGILIRYLTEEYHIPPLVLAFWRDLIVALTLAATLFFLAPKRIKNSARALFLHICLRLRAIGFQFPVDGVGRPEWSGGFDRPGLQLGSLYGDPGLVAAQGRFGLGEDSSSRAQPAGLPARLRCV